MSRITIAAGESRDVKQNQLTKRDNNAISSLYLSLSKARFLLAANKCGPDTEGHWNKLLYVHCRRGCDPLDYIAKRVF